MAYTAVGSASTGLWSSGTTFTITAVNPTAVGDVLVVWAGINGASLSVSSLSHSGVTTWTRLKNDVGSHTAEVWWGVVTATGSATLTITCSGTPTSAGAAVQQFNSVGTWSADANTAVGAGSGATSGNYPSVTPAGGNPLYVGAGHFTIAAGSLNSGTSGGFVSGALTISANALYLGYVYNLAPGLGASSPGYTATAAVGGSSLLADGFLDTPVSTLASSYIVRQAVQRAATR